MKNTFNREGARDRAPKRDGWGDVIAPHRKTRRGPGPIKI